MEYSLFKKILNIGYARRQINIILLVICSFFLRNFIDILIYGLLKSGYPAIDFILSVIITVFLTTKATTIEGLVKIFEEKLLLLTNYIIDNYSYARYRYLRKISIILSSALLIIYLNFVQITSIWLIMSVLHFLLCCIILEKIEDWQANKGIAGKLKAFLFNQQNKTQIIILDTYDHDNLFKSTYSEPVLDEKVLQVVPMEKVKDGKNVKVNGHKIDGTYP